MTNKPSQKPNKSNKTNKTTPPVAQKIVDLASTFPHKTSQTAPQSHIGNINTKHLLAFIAAVEQKNFSRAADQMFQSQPAFSRCIQELESDLGQELFARSNQGVSLSEFGHAFLPYAKRLLACQSDMLFAMTHWRGKKQNKLMLASAYALMPMVLPVLMRRLRHEFSQPQLDFVESSSEQVLASVLAGKAALGVVAHHVAHPELDCTPVLNAPLGLLASPDYPLPSVIKSLADLKNVPFVRFDDHAVVTCLLRQHSVVFDAYFSAGFECSNMMSALPLVRDEHMVLVVSAVGATHLQAQDMRFVPLPGLLPTACISIISRKDRPFDSHQHIMQALVHDSMRTTPWHASVRCL